ncbi:MAG: 2-dehydro-3-deoxygalactonokinase [Roseinatronobacter sp.]
MTRPDWIGVDWGTSHVRAYAMQGADCIAQAQSSDGMGNLAPEQFEAALLALVDNWLSNAHAVPVIACGMVGSRQGWIEAPYRAVPCTPLGQGMIVAPTKDPRLSVQIIPGLNQMRPADVMRGEETQIAGVIALNPGWDGVLCLPGTHSKWVHISAGEVVSFQTFLTGEMFALLSQHSVLRHSVAGWDDTGFAEGVTQGFERPEWLTARLFSLRAEGLLAGLDPARARARLSGLLIGAELGAARAYWLGHRVLVVGQSALSATYAKALSSLSVPVSTIDGTAATLAGLRAALPHLKEISCAR